MIEYTSLDKRTNRSISKDTSNNKINISCRAAAAILENAVVIDTVVISEEPKAIKMFYFLLESEDKYLQVVMRSSLVNGFVLYKTELSKDTTELINQIRDKAA